MPSPLILRYEDIEEALNKGQLITNAVNSSIQPASYDMRVGTIFRDGKIINDVHEERDRPFMIQPGEIVSIFTMEELKIPANIVGVAFAINKWSSEGFLVLNPGHIDPGYEGPLTVKAINLRKAPISISRGQPIFTVIFQEIGSSTTHPYPRPNQTRSERERSFHAREQEVGPASLADLLRAWKDSPFVTRDDVDKAIRSHWTSRWTFILLSVAAVASVIAAVAEIVKHH